MKNKQLSQAVKHLKQGSVIAYPTEAVYGLGCDPDNLDAIQKILDIKQRNKEKGLILIAENYEQLKPYLKQLNPEIEKEVLASWPGPVTFLIPAKASVSTFLKGKFQTLAVRVTNHPVAKKLCHEFGKAIVSTSANLEGGEPARTADEVKTLLQDKVSFILEGETDKNAQPSEIRDALTDEIIRSS